MSREGATTLVARDYLNQVHAAIASVSLDAINAVVDRLYTAYRRGRKVLIVGNGGSASTASHMACDLSKNVFGRVPVRSRSRKPFRVLALTDNVPIITAWANDTHYDEIFMEQVRTFTDTGDLLIAVSGSGNSPNVVEAVRMARSLGADTIGLLGFGGGKLKDLVDLAIIVDSYEYGPVEDVHLVLNHLFTECLRTRVNADEDGR